MGVILENVFACLAARKSDSPVGDCAANEVVDTGLVVSANLSFCVGITSGDLFFAGKESK